MAAHQLKVGEASRPRFEFRSFGQDFETAAWRMARLSIPVPETVWERHSAEVYIVSRTNDVNNTKIRNGKWTSRRSFVLLTTSSNGTH
jgi:hypothetical protein